MFKELNKKEVNIYHAPYLLQHKLWMLLWHTHALTCNDNTNNPTLIVVYES
jgi:hypothetical protein